MIVFTLIVSSIIKYNLTKIANMHNILSNHLYQNRPGIDFLDYYF